MDWWNLLYVVAGAVITWVWNELNKNKVPVTPTNPSNPVTPNPVLPVDPSLPVNPLNPNNPQFLLELIQALINKLHLSKPLSIEDIHPDALKESTSKPLV